MSGRLLNLAAPPSRTSVSAMARAPFGFASTVVQCEMATLPPAPRAEGAPSAEPRRELQHGTVRTVSGISSFAPPAWKCTCAFFAQPSVVSSASRAAWPRRAQVIACTGGIPIARLGPSVSPQVWSTMSPLRQQSRARPQTAHVVEPFARGEWAVVRGGLWWPSSTHPRGHRTGSAREKLLGGPCPPAQRVDVPERDVAPEWIPNPSEMRTGATKVLPTSPLQ